jgi:hypothetical protein
VCDVKLSGRHSTCVHMQESHGSICLGSSYDAAAPHITVSPVRSAQHHSAWNKAVDKQTPPEDCHSLPYPHQPYTTPCFQDPIFNRLVVLLIWTHQHTYWKDAFANGLSLSNKKLTQEQTDRLGRQWIKRLIRRV